jgi:transposase InsO family protein
LFSSLKVDRLHSQCFQALREAKDEGIAWLLWYTQTRMHSALGCRTPAEFEQIWQQERLKAAA